MYVKDSMSRDVQTIKSNQTVSEVIAIISETKFRRIPVVDDNNKLLGMITESIISSNTPNKASSLSVFEINYLLNKLKVEDIMIKDPITINEDALLEEAATIMNDKKIGCLSVVDKDNKLIGIITRNDIFTAFINLLGYKHNGMRYVINVKEDKPGIMEAIAKCFKENNISISNLAVYNTSRGIEVVVISEGKNDISKLLIDAGFNVTSVLSL